jgi:hypothetical protein
MTRQLIGTPLEREINKSRQATLDNQGTTSISLYLKQTILGWTNHCKKK